MVGANPGLRGAGVGHAVVKESGIFFFKTIETAGCGRGEEGGDAGRSKSVYRNIAAIAADLQYMRSSTQAIKGEGTGDGNQRVVEVEGGLVTAVYVHLGFATSIIG